MKTLLLLLTGLALLSGSAASQTELWRLWRPAGSYPRVAGDGLGNTYISELSAAGSTLAKVGPDGAVLWESPVAAAYNQLLPTAAGVYLSPPLYGGEPVHSYDANGNLLWSYSFPDRSYFAGYPAVTQDGGIVLGYSTAAPPAGDVAFEPIASTLVKLDAAGERVFEVTIPTVASDLREQVILGVAVASDGNIWVLAQARSEKETIRSSFGGVRSIGYDEAMLFDGTTGRLMMRKNIFRDVIEDWRDYASGFSRSFILNTGSHGGPAKFLAISGTTLVVGGVWDIQSTKCLRNGSCSYVSKSEWRVSVVSSSGSFSMFRYRGNGEVRTANGQTAEKSDESGNELREVLAGPNNDIYLHGTIARGRRARGVNDFAYHDVLMKYNLLTKKPVWKVMAPGGQGRITTALHPSSGVILRQSEPYSLDVYDLSGALGGGLLRFPDPVSLNSTEDRAAYYIPFTEAGTITLRGTGGDTHPGETYIAKYSIASVLASQRYAPPAATTELVPPETFALLQNYPNPFNPVTTIEFELPDHAVVTVTVFNSLGQEVATLADRDEFFAGANQLEFNADGLPSGVYYYRISAAGMEGAGTPFMEMRKMLLMK